MFSTDTERPEPIRCWLPAHVRVCSTVNGVVFLDLRRNRYFGLGQNDAVQLGIHGAISCPSAGLLPVCREGDALCDELVTAGLLTRVPPGTSMCAYAEVDLDAPIVSVGLEINSQVGVCGRDVMNFVHACIWARWAIRSRSLWSITNIVSRLKRSGMLESDPVVTSRTIDLVCAFRQLRPFAFAARGQCLLHALALVRYLLAYDVCSTWVIGVRTKPWAAHSWVQQGSTVLDANPEAIVEYTPILAA